MAIIPSAGTPVLNSVVATTTSVAVNVENYTNITVQFTAASISSGNGVLTIDVSDDGVNYYTGIAFVDSQTTTTTTAVTSKTLSSNTTFVGFIPFNGFKYMRVKVTRTTDGTYTVWLHGNLIR